MTTTPRGPFEISAEIVRRAHARSATLGAIADVRYRLLEPGRSPTSAEIAAELGITAHNAQRGLASLTEILHDIVMEALKETADESRPGPQESELIGRVEPIDIEPLAGDVRARYLAAGVPWTR